MTKQKVMDLINETTRSVLELSRKNHGPIKQKMEGFRFRDVEILIYIYSHQDGERVTMSGLAKHLRITPAAASQIVSCYEKNGWVHRVRCDRDRRTVYLRVSDEVSNKILAKWEDHQQNLSKFLDEIGEEDCEHLYRILIKAHEYFGDLTSQKSLLK